MLPIALIAALGGLVYGYDTGTISGALSFLKSSFHLTVLEQELSVSIVLVGSMIGSILAGRIADRIGRKKILLLAGMISFVFTLITAYAPNYSLFLLFRILVGITLGVISIASPMYLSESSPSHSRGGNGATFQLAVAIGITLSFWGDYFFSKTGNWHAMFVLSAIPALLLLCFVTILPESPRWLLATGRKEVGEQALYRLFPKADVKNEIQQIEIELQETSTMDTGSYLDLLKPKVRLALIFAVLFSISQQLSGINTITYYSPTVFQLAGFPTSASILTTAVIGVITVFSTLLGVFLVDRLGRRKLAMTSIVGMVLSMALLGMAFKVGPQHTGMSIITVGSVVLYHISFSSGMGPLVWVLLPEIFPNRLRGRGQSVATFANWIANFFISTYFLSIVHVAGAGNSFWIFSALNILILMFVAKMTPETKGKPLESIEKYWDNGMKWEA